MREGFSRKSHTFRQRFVATGSLGEELLAFWNSLSTETDTLLGVENGTFPDEGLDATGTTVDLVQGDLVDNLRAVLSVSVMLEEYADM